MQAVTFQGRVTPSLRVQEQSSSKGINVELDNSEPEMCHYLSFMRLTDRQLRDSEVVRVAWHPRLHASNRVINT